MFIKILWSKFALWALIFLLLQQLIVASSTIWISDLSEAVVLGTGVGLYLFFFVASLFVVYIPGIISSYYLEKAKSLTIYKYTQAFAEKHRCTPELMADKEFQSEREPWLTSESSKTIEETYGVVYDSAATGLNTTLNIAALCIAIDPRMLIGYLASFAILPVVSHYFKIKLADAAIVLQNDRKSMSQILLHGWDNIIVGNIYNFAIWWKQFTKRWGAYNQASVDAVLVTHISSACATVLSLIPVACVFLWIFLTTNETIKLAALVATLPRQIQIIQHFEILATYAMYWHGTWAKLKALIATITVPEHDKANLLARIKEDEITLTVNKNKTALGSVENFFKIITEMPNGRVTIQGRNGSGKTTLVNLLKKELGDKAYYLPTHSRLMFESTIEDSFSTGQRIKAYLDELSNRLLNAKQSDRNNQVILLDEWDANLDASNMQIISKMLDNLSREHCVIEISHRQ